MPDIEELRELSEKATGLLPCPFCGEAPERFPSGDGTGTMIECFTPGCVNPHVSYYGDGEAEKRWNTRHSLATRPSSEGVGELWAERDFLLARAKAAGSCSFSSERWTGMSSNALVTIAFGGEDEALPFDAMDLCACYRTVLRLPPHLVSEAVLAQLKRGEEALESREVEWATEKSGWPGYAALKGSNHG